MKNATIRLTSILAWVFLVSPLSFAQGKGASQPAPVTSSYAASNSSRWGLGLMSFTGVTAGDGAIAAWFDFDGKNTLQPFLAVSGTSPEFGFGVGALFRHSVTYGTNAGFHIGGGFGLGTAGNQPNNNPLNILIAGVAGIHVNFPGTSDLLLLFDGGPALTLSDGNASFGIGPFSGLLGASLIYIF